MFLYTGLGVVEQLGLGSGQCVSKVLDLLNNRNPTQVSEVIETGRSSKNLRLGFIEDEVELGKSFHGFNYGCSLSFGSDSD